ncbi:MAG: TetR/AcrR family transcriptional regulator [Bacteroidales bacterium]|nr:TetR/AcrR family transcriptional regulator [Bacteroidales bacterium]
MQIKKTEVEEAIMAEAEKEFYAYGFEHSSVRRIIRAAGTSIGNFYNYFENKEALFNAVVSEEYHTFIRFITQHEQEEGSMLSRDILKQPDWKQQISSMLNRMLPEFISRILPDFSIRFVILVEGSRGTRYEDTGDRLVNLVKEHLREHGRETGCDLPDDSCELLARQFMSGLVAIIKQYHHDEKSRNRLLTQYIIFVMSGVAGLMGIEL